MTSVNGVELRRRLKRDKRKEIGRESYNPSFAAGYKTVPPS